MNTWPDGTPKSAGNAFDWKRWRVGLPAARVNFMSAARAESYVRQAKTTTQEKSTFSITPKSKGQQ